MAIVEITYHTLHHRYLLLGTDDATSTLLGILGRAQDLHQFPLFAYNYLPNRLRLLIGVYNVQQLADLLQCLASNTSREIGRLVNWTNRLWNNRANVTVILDEESLVQVVKELLSEAAFEGYVEDPESMPGPQCARPLCRGTTESGIWNDRTEAYKQARARERAKNKEKWDQKKRKPTTLTYPVILSKLPCWAHLDDDQYQEKCATITRLRAARAKQERNGAEPIGAVELLEKDPHHIPPQVSDCKPSLVRCQDEERKNEYLKERRQFSQDYWLAHQRLKRGIEPFDFPRGCIPPGCRGLPLGKEGGPEAFARDEGG